eukprot:CAMPEP_0168392880 /NCGR_PEP_ID=MMETSP0228-20121227/18725_1 /TAXON_ID=133427 /ORGANISM="Protoceratium reticulatum, Strain CCCM 535 (=CCMP 1889)" /LENGTH=75 /DNA_ID=CAMNT_0008406233 /DNA_START=207 /DNA_END=431 /DNA_ORIENTATION=-
MVLRIAVNAPAHWEWDRGNAPQIAEEVVALHDVIVEAEPAAHLPAAFIVLGMRARLVDRRPGLVIAAVVDLHLLW